MTKQQPEFTPPAALVEWLEQGQGRAAYFHKVDAGLFPSMISKIKSGHLPVSFEVAIRLERAQKASDTPLKAEDLMTFLQHRALYRYVTGIDPAPAQVDRPQSSGPRTRTPAEARA